MYRWDDMGLKNVWLPDGAASPFVGVLGDGSVARVGAGDTATLAAFLSVRGRNGRLSWAETFQA